MSGHSKWHNIRLRKGKQDAERGKVFTKLAREIIVAAKAGGGNPDTNLRLRLAVQKARDNSMPADNIKRAIQRGTGELEGVNYDEVTYEGYGSGGVAVMVQCLTDNRNRTVADLRAIFSKCGGNMGETGCVGWIFENKGVVHVNASDASEDDVLMAVMDAGAEDVTVDGEVIEVSCPPENLTAVREALDQAGIAVLSAEPTMVPQNTVRVEGKEASQVLRLMDMLEDHDDVQHVFANFDIPEEVLQEAGA
ncbi:MAG: YebC/PmpR family DNA-binding transcriptional regulator [Armatimonadetes bacterium]|nr:YebC/PmpR family DNA-binding transcriptional regulator [Armatimonadota bacterium]